ncbi:hypothetical protein [Nocardia brasiliensis]|uniref:hypothetical protein n=1 Tax=Nocardia brasiliensis TaxID=37326 RepID=UPI0024543B52|nr:hypothetical protein [Nocardia brasiliensis]
MSISINTRQHMTQPPTVEYEPAHGFTYGPDTEDQIDIPAQIWIRFGSNAVALVLDIDDARALLSQMTGALAMHDIATADYSVDLVKAVA